MHAKAEASLRCDSMQVHECPSLQGAMGRAYLVGLQPAEREAILQELRPLYGAEWPNILKGVQAALRDVANRVDFVFLPATGKKIFTAWRCQFAVQSDGRVFAINLGGPAYLLPVAEMTQVLGPRLLRVAKEIEFGLTRRD